MVEKLKTIITKSVEDSLKGVERPFGVLLSGGVDSGLLASLTRPDYALTCRFHGEKYDEFEYAEKIVKFLNLKHIVIEPTKEDFFNYLGEAVNAFQPTTHFSLIPLFMLFKKAEEMGLKTILSGEGPDEYLGGYASYSFITNEQKLYEQEELENYHNAIDKYLGNPIKRFSKIIGKPVKDIKPYWKKYENLLSKMGYADLKLRGIEDMELALAEHFGINLIYPYMTEEVEKFCFEEIPDEMKIKDFTTKYIFRKVAGQYLPHEVVWRKNKMGGPVAPIGVWLDQKDEFDKTKYLELQNNVWKSSR